MKSIQREFLIGLIFLILMPIASWADTVTERYFYQETVRYQYDIEHQVVKGYSVGTLGPDFFSNDWDQSWIGDPLALQPGDLIGDIGLTAGQVTYLSGLTGLQSSTLYYIDLLDMAMNTGTGPVTNANAAETGFQNYMVSETGPTIELIDYVYDINDPFNLFMDHYITTFVDQYNHSFTVIGAFNDLEEPGAAPVPEPATMLLLGSGLVGFAASRRKFRK